MGGGGRRHRDRERQMGEKLGSKKEKEIETGDSLYRMLGFFMCVFFENFETIFYLEHWFLKPNFNGCCELKSYRLSQH